MPLRMIAILFSCFFASTIYAYERGYELDGSFLVEAHYPGESKTLLEIWRIDLLQGLAENKVAFTDFSLVIVALSLNKDTNCYSVIGTEIHKYNPGNQSQSLLYVNDSFLFEFGILRKLNIKIVFNTDGTLADITGSLFNKDSPENVTIFMPQKDSRQVCITQDNNFVTKNYLYNKRRR